MWKNFGFCTGCSSDEAPDDEDDDVDDVAVVDAAANGVDDAVPNPATVTCACANGENGAWAPGGGP